MNWKQVLYKGLPIFLIAAVIVIVAVIASRPKKQPELSSPDKDVVNYQGLKVTNSSLYNLLKQVGGTSTLIDIIDRNILAEYKDDIDIEKVREAIEDSKNQQGEHNFYQNMILQGVISSKDDENADELLEEYFRLSYLQETYAKAKAIEDLKAEDIQKAKDDYKEDICIITIEFEKESEADVFADELAAAADKLQLFEDKWVVQHKDDEQADEDEDAEELSFIASFNCEYERAVYDEYSTSAIDLRDFIFADSYKYYDKTTNENVTQEFKTGDYTEKAKYINTDKAYYFVYKLANPTYINAEDTPNFRDLPEFDEYIKDKLVSPILTDMYVISEIIDLHNSLDLKIYDSVIAEAYKALDKDFKEQKKLLDDKTVATYKFDGETIKITADDLYKNLKTIYGTQLLLEKINYESLAKISDIQLTKKEKENILDQIKIEKTNYISRGQDATWSEFIASNYYVFNEKDLSKMYAVEQLRNRYILGYEDYIGQNPVTDADINEAYDNWIAISASHILFEFDKDDAASEALALQKANQIINGCTSTEVDNEECYIYYEVEDEENVDEEDDGVIDPFKGLYNTAAKNYETVFADLAKEYSDDPGASSNLGSLGLFGHGDMVPEFEAAAIEIANRGDGKYSLEPVKTEFGYHVIYVKSSQEKTEKPDFYDAYKTDEENDVDLEDKYSAEEISEANSYASFIKTLKTDIENERTSINNRNILLAQLRSDSEFKFLDADLQAIYETVNDLQKNYDPDAE